MSTVRVVLASLVLAPFASIAACGGSPTDSADAPQGAIEGTVAPLASTGVKLTAPVDTVEKPVIVIPPKGIELATPSLITFDTVPNDTNLSQPGTYQAQGVFFSTVTGAAADGCGQGRAPFISYSNGSDYAVLDYSMADGGAAVPPCAAGQSGAWCAPAPDKNVVSIAPDQATFSGIPANAPANQGPTQQIMVAFSTARSFVSITARANVDGETLGGNSPNLVYLAAYDANWNCIGETTGQPNGQWQQLAFTAPTAGTIAVVILSTEYNNAQNPVFAEFDNLQYL